MIKKHNLSLNSQSLEILQAGILEFKIFSDGVNYIDKIFLEEKNLNENFKREVLKKWLKNFRKANNKLLTSVLQETTKQRFKPVVEEIDKLEEFLQEKRNELEESDLKKREVRKLHLKMVERFLETLYPIPQLADTIVHEKKKNHHQKWKGSLNKKKKSKILIPKINAIEEISENKQLDKIDKKFDDNEDALKKFLQNTIIKCENQRINYHSTSKKKN